MNLTEFAPVAEVCTATFTSHVEQTGENFDGPICVGIYPGTTDEIWIEFMTPRANLNVNDIEGFIKQLRRAVKIAKDQTNG